MQMGRGLLCSKENVAWFVRLIPSRLLILLSLAMYIFLLAICPTALPSPWGHLSIGAYQCGGQQGHPESPVCCGEDGEQKSWEGAYLESHLSPSMPTRWCRVVVVTMSFACGFRQALVDHYSKLSAEAARREQKALWRIQRHRLESARLRFLLEDQKRIQVWQWCQLPALAHSYVLTLSCCIRTQMVLAEAQASSQT